MARKKIEPIVGLGNEDKLTVQKSLPLFALWRSELTLSEFKILDTYLSRIDSHKPEKRQVLLTKGEIEEALGVQKINNPDLKERLKHLMGSVVEVPDKDTKKGFRLVTLFEEAEAEQDENGLWQVKLECTQKAMRYFFNVENLGYLRYKLRCITSLTSRYTYIMFVYLEANRFRKSWEVELDELKAILHCEDEETYKEFKRFNDRLLKRVQKEMHEKTECRYTYEPVKKGRKVIAVRFTLETLNDLEGIPEKDYRQLSLEDCDRYDSLPEWERWIEDYCKICDDTFTKTEMEEFIGLTNKLPLSSMYKNSIVDDIQIHRYDYILDKYRTFKTANSRKPIRNKYLTNKLPLSSMYKNSIVDDIQIHRYDYILDKYRTFKTANSRKPIRNKYAYFKTMIEKDISEYE